VSPDGRLVASAERDNSIRVWRTSDAHAFATLRGSTSFVSGIAFTPRGDLVAASSHDGSVRVWRVGDEHPLLTLDGGKKRVGAVAINRDGTLLASGNEDGTIHVWRLPSGEPEVVRQMPSGSVASVAFSGDGDRLVAGGRGGVARVWRTGDWSDPVELRRTRTRALVVQALLNKDGDRVATLDQNGVARLWSGDGGPPLRTLWQVGTIAFSPDGTQLLAGGGKATGQIVRTSDGQNVGLLRGHTDVVNDAQFAPEGDLVVTAAGSGSGFPEDNTVRLWQAETSGPIAVFSPSVSPVLRATLAADGRLVTVSDDGVRLYVCEPCLRPERLRAIAKERLAAR
jgi:WD40 repeat protein